MHPVEIILIIRFLILLIVITIAWFFDRKINHYLDGVTMFKPSWYYRVFNFKSKSSATIFAVIVFIIFPELLMTYAVGYIIKRKQLGKK